MTADMHRVGMLFAAAAFPLVGLGGLVGVACDTGASETTGPKAEVAETAYNLEMPAVPEFPDSKPYPDGSHSVTEMRRKGAKYVGTKDLKITGYVVFKYDLETCARE